MRGNRYVVACLLVMFACRRDDRDDPGVRDVTSVQNGAGHVFTVRAPYRQPVCGTGYEIERLEKGAWVSAGVWYRYGKNCVEFVDSYAPAQRVASRESSCRCDLPGDGHAYEKETNGPFDLTWSGNTTAGPAPLGRYRLVIAGVTHEFEHR